MLRPSFADRQVADDLVLTFDNDNNVVLIEFVGGVRQVFADLIDKEVEARLRKLKAS